MKKLLPAALAALFTATAASADTKADTTRTAADTTLAVKADSAPQRRSLGRRVADYFRNANKGRRDKKFDFSILGGPHYNTNTQLGLGLVAAGLYNTDRSIIIVLPQDVATTTATGEAYLKVENAAGEALYQPFYVFTEDEQPVITKFSATTLTPGSQLCITGENLGGATEVYLPLAFDQKVKCELDPAQPSSDTEVYVIVPEGVNFAEGQVEIVMNKVYAPTGAEYTDKAYSEVTNFTN